MMEGLSEPEQQKGIKTMRAAAEALSNRTEPVRNEIEPGTKTEVEAKTEVDEGAKTEVEVEPQATARPDLRDKSHRQYAQAALVESARKLQRSIDMEKEPGYGQVEP